MSFVQTIFDDQNIEKITLLFFYAGITRIKELLRSQEATEFDLLLRHMEPNQPNSVDNMLRNISNLGETNIMIDCSIYGTFVFFNHAFDMQMILPSYNYVVVNLAVW